MNKTFRRIILTVTASLVLAMAGSVVVFAGSSSSPAETTPAVDYTTYQAKIGSNYVQKLQDAVNQCASGGTLTIELHYSPDNKITITGKRNVTINTAGITWSAGGSDYLFYVEEGSTLTINGTGNGSKLLGASGYNDKGKTYGGIGLIQGTVNLKGSLTLGYSGGAFPNYGGLFAVDRGGVLNLSGSVTNDGLDYNPQNTLGVFYIQGGTMTVSESCQLKNMHAKCGAIYLTDGATFKGSCPSTYTSNYAGFTQSTNVIYCDGTSNKVTLSGKFNMDGGNSAIEVVGSGNTITISDNAVIKNFTAVNGSICIKGDKNTVNISSNKISSNKATKNGGFLYVEGSANTVTVNGSASISSNSAGENGGAIYIYGSGATQSTLTISGDAAFTSNSASKNGGAVFAQGNVKLTVGEKAYFKSCTAAENGGAIAVQKADSASPALEIDYRGSSNTFSSCTAKNGGALYVSESTVSLKGATAFADNQASSNNGHDVYTVGVSTLSIAESYKTKSNGGYDSYGCPQFTNSLGISGSMIYTEGCSKLDFAATSGNSNLVFKNTKSDNKLQAFATDKSATTVNLKYVQFKGFDDCNSVFTAADNATVTVTDCIFESCNCNLAPISIESSGTLKLVGSTKFESCSGFYNAGAIDCAGKLSIEGTPEFKKCTSTNGPGAIYAMGDVTLSGGTIIDCSGNEAVIYAPKAKTVNLSDVSISSCTSKGNGAALYAPEASVNLYSVTIKNCSTSKSDAQGGVINAKNLSLSGSTSINGGTAAYGGAVYVTEQLTMNGTASILNCSASQDGGAVYSKKNVTLNSQSSIGNCTAAGDGGGVYVESGNFVMSGNAYISNCKASGNGGGLYLYAGSADISGSKSSSTSAAYLAHCSAVNGGCIYVKSGELNFGGESFTNGSKGTDPTYLAEKGGSIYLASGAKLNMEGKASLRYTAAAQGGGIYAESGSTVNITGSANVSLCSAKTAGSDTPDGQGGGIYNLGTLTLNSSSDGGFSGCSAKQGGNIYNAGTFTMSSGGVTYGSAGVTSGSGKGGGELYAASGSTATIDGENVKFSNGMPNDFQAEAGSKINIANGRFFGKFDGDTSAYNITGGWFIKASYIQDLVKSPYNVSPVLKDAPDENVPIKVYHDNEKATVTFYNNCEGGGDAVIETPKGYEIAIPECTVERESWEALSWNTDPTGNGTVYYPNSDGPDYKPNDSKYHLKPTSDMNLYADWTTKEHATRTLTFIDPSNVNKTQTITYTDREVLVTFPNFYRDMYTLLGATIDEKGNGALLESGDEVNFGYKVLDATVYLQWQSNIDAKNTSKDTNTIYYNDSNIVVSGSGVSKTYSTTVKTQTENVKFKFKTSQTSTTIIDAGFVSQEYSFDCWCDSESGNGKMYAVGDTYNFGGGGQTVNLYAVWKAKSDISDYSTRYGEYTETGGGKVWDLEEEDPQVEEKHEEYITPGYYKLTYNDGFGDNSPFTQSYSDTKARVMGSLWTRNGYKFSGWTTTEGSDKVEYVSGDTIDISGNPELYAVWTKTSSSDTPTEREEIIEQNDDPSYDPVEEYKELDDKKNQDKNDAGTDTDKGGSSGGDSNVPEGFLDEDEQDEYYAEAAEWAYEEGITTGDSEGSFNAEAPCTRAEMITFLWRSMGEPSASITTNPFTDIKSSDYFYEAVLWGYGEGIVKGTSATTFSPNDTTTRAQGLTFLYRTVGEPSVDLSLISKFTDVKADQYYTDAVAWAIEDGITTGTTTTTFSPDKTCTRGEIITFMYRALGTSTY